MSKGKAAAVLGGLILTGLMLVSSLAVAGGGKNSKDQHSKHRNAGYFAQLGEDFRRGCWEEAFSRDPKSFIPPEPFLAACLFIVRTLIPLEPDQLPRLDQVLTNRDAEDIEEAALEAFRKETPGLKRRSSCDECVQAVSDLEADLATNGTARDITDALENGCDERFFRHFAKARQCRSSVSPIPVLIDFVLANLPPVTVCRELKFCPVTPEP
jgi:hypothetical protein